MTYDINTDKTAWGTILQSAITEPGKLSAGYSAFHSYSLGNQLAAAFQLESKGLPIAPIASFRAWKEKGRNVKKGEKALALCMPVSMKGTKHTTKGDEEFTFNRFVWRNNWFSLDQTEGEDYQNEVTIPVWDKNAALLALEITEGRFNLIDGNCQGYADSKMIAINPLAVLPHKTRFHELAHVVLGHTVENLMSDNDKTPKSIKEAEAEGVAYLLCTLLGLPGQAESRDYIQSWLQGATIPEKSAQRIFGAADKILKAGKLISV